MVGYIWGKLDYAGGAELNGKGGITMDFFQQEIPCSEYWVYLNRGLNLRVLDLMGNGQPGLIWMGNLKFIMDGLSSWTQQERRDNQRLISIGNYKFGSVMHTILVLCIFFFLFAFYLRTGSCSLDEKKIQVILEDAYENS